ncbi:ribosomal RNA small subunit methyltransferase A [Fulvitalea axinellae]|uniref:Ribosomal RNA small subunit methyltransferase A n=1 Tax=Fulvitalea axinellae TaxID=1182444 RepID=A0AAU9CR93_9BACT|nr:ribosomal RNA small subunit methyltransferase A [Fulvitalea axinellae]
MKKVRAKKHLGQHFLTDLDIAERIVNALSGHGGYRDVLEVGPGMGVLTDFLIERESLRTFLVDIDTESIAYLKDRYPALGERIIEGDFLRMDLTEKLESPMAVIGNFPYNISSQIFFKVLEYRDDVTECVGMVQKEVAERICAGPGSKVYGILSVLLQAFYDAEYLFTVPPHVFNPPPKVDSAVLSLKRNDTKDLGCDEKLFFRVVKQAFQTRRKTLRNALKVFGLSDELRAEEMLSLRAERLSVADFVWLTNRIENDKTPG